MVGKTISHYKVLEKLGEGGMGVVYKAEDIRLRRAVALKFLHPEAVENEELKTRFLHEAEAAAALNHPNICTVYDIDEAEGHSFIAMEWIEGESLAENIKKRPLQLGEALGFTMQVAEGLRAAHNKGIVHRDIKSANVMIDTEGRVKIMDFGLAHLAGHTKITKTGVTLGTPAYMSPEQVRGQTVDHRTDTWSLGVVLYEMITGWLPFRGELAQAVMYSILNEEQEPPTALRSGLPIDLDRVVGKALAKSPEQRYQHIDDLLVDLRTVRRQLEVGERPHPQQAPPRVEISIGQMLGHYRLESKLGEGGMGVVYRALDTHLDRPVAIKLLRSQTIPSEERKRRFVQESKAASALNHPNIVTIHDISAAGGIDFIVMEYVGGETLDRLACRKGLALREALNYAVLAASALAKAHEAGIVHRDIKPGNIMVTPDGVVKILDFGLAKLTETARAEAVARLHSRESPETGEGQVLGTVAYMSPEQAEGKPVDARSDIFSFGTVLYEMLAGHRPFQGDSELSTLISILRDSPEAIEEARPDVPRELRRIVARCLERNLDARYPSAAELARDLEGCQARLAAPGRRPVLLRPRYFVPALVLVVAVCLAGWRFYLRSSRRHWADREAIFQIRLLVDEQKYGEAFRLAEEAERYAPQNHALAQLWPIMSRTVSVQTTPPGAEVYVKEYANRNGNWRMLGRSPIKQARVPMQYYRWRIVKEGFETIEVADPFPPYSPAASRSMDFPLSTAGSLPRGMVRVPQRQFSHPLGSFGISRQVVLPSYLMDQFEVTNKQFQQFVNSGAYQKREQWKHEFSADGQVLGWENAMRAFVDATGRAGPSTWALGTFPDGQQDFPVAGVSWFEAQAYCEFLGKTLPTLFHWTQAAGLQAMDYIIPLSNIGSRSVAAVGSHQGLSPYGCYDMAGNVKEWCWNSTGTRRFILGGGWNEVGYMFGDPDARSPIDRSAANGFRCAKYDEPQVLPPEITGIVRREIRDYRRERPASGEVVQFYRGLFSYDRTPLNERVESIDESAEHWVRERVTFDAAYGKERVTAYLFRPKSGTPPYQTVVYFPGASAENIPSSASLSGLGHIEPMVRSGRAVLYPVYQGTYERLIREGGSQPVHLSLDTVVLSSPSAYRDKLIMVAKDLFRSLDYLETRRDIRSDSLAYIGNSLGARLGPIFLATEGRFKAAVLLNGGLHLLPKRLRLAEVDEINYAPQVTIPVLMLNGKHDFLFLMEKSQVPLFEWLGTSKSDKRHVLFDRGHSTPFLSHGELREILDWLDRYLGTVR